MELDRGLKLPKFWICCCGRQNFATPCLCGRKKSAAWKAQMLRTWGLFPTPRNLYALCASRVVETTSVADREELAQALLDVGVVVVNDGEEVLLTCCGLDVQPENLRFKNNSVGHILRVRCWLHSFPRAYGFAEYALEYLLLQAALVGEESLYGSVYFKCPACLWHCSDDSSSHSKRCATDMQGLISLMIRERRPV